MKDSKIILVPTFHRKPLRLKHSYKGPDTSTSSHSIESPPSTQDDLFLYFTLTSNQGHGLLCASEKVHQDVSLGFEEEKRSYRFSAEVHPDHDGMFGLLDQSLPDDIKAWLQ